MFEKQVTDNYSLFKKKTLARNSDEISKKKCSCLNHRHEFQIDCTRHSKKSGA